MPKGKKNKSDNPLSVARKRQRQEQSQEPRGGGGGGGRRRGSSRSSGRTTVADEIWYRKAGLGYRCFVDYYCHHVTPLADMDEADKADPQQQQDDVDTTTTPASVTTTTTRANAVAAARTRNEEETSLSDLADDDHTKALSSSSSSSKRPACLPLLQPAVPDHGGMSRAAQRRRRQKCKHQQAGNSNTAICSGKNDHDDEDGHEKHSEGLVAVATSSRRASPPSPPPPPPYKNGITNVAASSSSTSIDTTNGFAADIARHPLYRAWKEAGQPVHMESFVATLCRPLPVTVRVRATVTDDAERRRLSADLTTSQGFTAVVAPEEGIYQLADNVAKADLSPEQRQWLVTANETGKIARQELGSMLPVRLLAALLARSSSSSTSSSTPPTAASIRILDLCASPGSKTLQALEVFTNATIIANDINANRLAVLREAVQRSGLSNDVIGRIQYTNQDASTLKLYTATATAAKKNSASNGSSRSSSGAKPQLAKFRLILCDVPCSGDGTCRKDPSILPQWKPTIGNQLHAVQLAILQRGLAFLKPGGYLCYSTCSMYPVENEAVVAAALMMFAQKKRIDRDDGAATAAVEEVVELVDCPTEATRGFRLAPGLRHWIVAGHDATVEDDTGMVFYESYKKALEHSSESSTTSWLSSMWPPTSSVTSSRSSSSSSSNEKQVSIQLSRCRRLWPHHQNSGGFFVAMFHKKAKKKQTHPK